MSKRRAKIKRESPQVEVEHSHGLVTGMRSAVRAGLASPQRELDKLLKLERKGEVVSQEAVRWLRNRMKREG